jgi:hypothetical protein
MSSNPMTTIPFSAVSVNLLAGAVSPNGGTQSSGNLGAPLTLISGDANTGTTTVGASGLLQYKLNVPAGQAPGSYTGGLVTYTATA